MAENNVNDPLSAGKAYANLMGNAAPAAPEAPVDGGDDS